MTADPVTILDLHQCLVRLGVLAKGKS